MATAQRLSADALELAKEVADRGSSDERLARADQLAAAIDELRSTSGSDELEMVVTDAVLDIDWVRSGCRLPTSTRLHYHLAEQGWEGPPQG